MVYRRIEEERDQERDVVRTLEFCVDSSGGARATVLIAE